MPLLLLLLFLLSFSPSAQGLTRSFKSLGVNYGQLGNNLRSPSTSINLILHTLHASSVKLYDANPSILHSLSSTNLTVAIMLPNELIPSLSTNQSFSDSWIKTNLLPFYPTTRIRYLLIGNELLSDYSIQNSTWPRILPAMIKIRKSLKKYSIPKVKVGTTLAMDTLSVSFPPSAGQFRPDISDSVIKPLLKFLNRTKSFYFVDAYTYFPWAANPTSIDLNYALLQADPSRYYVDKATNLTYTNLLDQQLDAVLFAMKRLGFGQVRIVIAETGWPNGGDLDQIGANVYNAATYNRNLAKRMRIRPPVGTPARPGSAMPVFLFALFNENQKGGPGTERHWGLLYPNGSKVYDVDLTGKRTEYPPLALPKNNQPYKGKIWCVLREGGVGNLTQVGEAVSYACGQGKGTCDAIQKGQECFEPNTLTAHASYAFNAYWQKFRKSGGTCYFSGMAEQTANDPSHGSCKFPSLAN